jgi:hypothetical protein
MQCEPGFYCTSGVRRKCAAGVYGKSYGLSKPDCDGKCAPGHYCPQASTSYTQVRYTLYIHICIHVHEVLYIYIYIGSYSEFFFFFLMHQLHVFCSKVRCPAGRFGAPVRNSSLVSTNQNQETVNYQVKLDGGNNEFDDDPGLRSHLCHGQCKPGYYCPEGSTSGYEFKCGGDDVYCPEGAGQPFKVTEGYYSVTINENNL